MKIIKVPLLSIVNSIKLNLDPVIDNSIVNAKNIFKFSSKTSKKDTVSGR